jgi:hypothetical protein
MTASVCFTWIGVRSRDFERENSKAVEQHANRLDKEREKIKRFSCRWIVQLRLKGSGSQPAPRGGTIRAGLIVIININNKAIKFYRIYNIYI